MSVNPLDLPMERAVVIVAHPDDECIAFGALLQRARQATVVYCTDGAPFDPYFWKERYGSRERYQELRKQEARKALETVAISEIVFLAEDPRAEGRLADQELFRNLDVAHGLLREVIEAKKASALLTLAYEGGHPDHDSCNFLTSQLSRESGIPAFEAPLYHRAGWAGEGRNPNGVQRFIRESGDVIDVYPTETEIARKLEMCAQYSSQGDFLQIFDVRREVVRPLAKYDYRLPPHEGRLNYEVWQWRMTGQEVCGAFAEFEERLASRVI